MKAHLEVINSLTQLEALATSWEETASSLSVEGRLSAESLQALTDVVASFEAASLALPNLRLDEESYDRDGLIAIASDDPMDWPGEWKIGLDKGRMLDEVPAGDEALVFLRREAFVTWSERLSPFELGGIKRGVNTHVIVSGLKSAFGGPRLSVLPLRADLSVEPENGFKFPEEPDVLKLIHVISDRSLLMDPGAVALTWGDREQDDASALRRLSAMVVALCMVQDVYLRDNAVRVVLRGTRRVELPLVAGQNESVSVSQLDEIYAAVEWIFSEREETRHKLLTDRLSIDVRDDTSLMSALTKFLTEALKQAKERYGFVILDRKDAYHKELRDLMKDVRAQADLYAAKVRDLVAALSRDTLAVLFMIGVSLVGRTNTNAIQGLVSTTEVQIFFKVLAIYFVLSIVLQGVSHWRDLSLARREGSEWHKLTREYVPQSTFEEHFEAPRRRRHNFFKIALVICAAVYFALAWLSWNIASVFSIFSGVAVKAGTMTVGS